MQIIIYYDKTYTLNINSFDTVLKLKEKIEHKTKFTDYFSNINIQWKNYRSLSICKRI